MQEQSKFKGVSLNRFFAKIYLLMSLGVAISAFMSYLLLFANPLQETLVNLVVKFPLGIWGLFLLEMGLVLYLSRLKAKNVVGSLVGFGVFSAVNGLVIGIILSAYEMYSVVQAFAGASGMFLAMGLTGIFIKKDLSGIAHAAISLLWGVIIVSVINVFFIKSAGIDGFLPFLSVVIFSVLTAYDHQKIKVIFQKMGPSNSVAIYMALNLYLDFVNLFLSLLRIFGVSRD